MPEILSKAELEGRLSWVAFPVDRRPPTQVERERQALTTALHYLQERDEAREKWSRAASDHETALREVERLRAALEELRDTAHDAYMGSAANDTGTLLTIEHLADQALQGGGQ